MDFILDKYNTGKYAMAIGTDSGSASHCIAIDCGKKLIYDCMEKEILTLNKKNLDYCAGVDQISTTSFPHCYELIQLPPSKKETGEQVRKNKKRKSDVL